MARGSNALDTISEFKGDYAFLSNFFIMEESIRVSWGHHLIAKWVNTTEHAYQAGKATTLEDFEYICHTTSPGQAKRAGRKIAIREDWEKNKVAHMNSVLRLKFFGSPSLGEALLATGDALLIEGNNWGDKFWGVTLDGGVGENYLGRLLMNVRDSLRVAHAAKELVGEGRPYY